MNIIQIFKALSDENRIRILNLLMESELCVCEIELILDMTQSNVSRHLNKLKNVGIVNSFKKAQWVHYQINNNYNVGYTFLYKYLKDELNKNQKCLEDIKRLLIYKNSNFTCKHIREDKELLLEYLEKNN